MRIAVNMKLSTNLRTRTRTMIMKTRIMLLIMKTKILLIYNEDTIDEIDIDS